MHNVSRRNKPQEEINILLDMENLQSAGMLSAAAAVYEMLNPFKSLRRKRC